MMAFRHFEQKRGFRFCFRILIHSRSEDSSDSDSDSASVASLASVKPGLTAFAERKISPSLENRMGHCIDTYRPYTEAKASYNILIPLFISIICS